jgi:hypothetical protein
MARRRGLSRATVLGAVLRQPTWWPLLWYPRRWRRPWDVWDRLPRPFRVFRGAMTMAIAAVIALVPLAAWAAVEVPWAASGRRGPLLGWLSWKDIVLPAIFLLYPLLAASSLVAVVSLAAGARHVLALNLDVYDRRRVASALMSGPTARRSLWKRAEIARALRPAPGPAASGPAEPRTPREYLSAIGRAGGGVAEAERIVAGIEGLDSELERLGRDADAGEAGRLRERLGALGPPADDESEERRRLRRLLGEQLELLARVESRIASAGAQRQERLDALRALWRAGPGTDTPTRTSAA